MLVGSFMASRFFRVSRVLVSAVLLFFCVLWLVSPWVIHNVLSDRLAQQGLSLSEDSRVRYNPFLARLTITQFQFSDIQSRRLVLNNAIIDISMPNLLWREVKFEKLTVSGLELNVERDEDGWILSGVRLPKNEHKQAVTPSERRSFVSQLVVLAPVFEIVDSELSFNDGTSTRFLEINQLRIENAKVSGQIQQFQITSELSFFDEGREKMGQFESLTDISIEQGVGYVNTNARFNDMQLALFRQELSDFISNPEGVFSLSFDTQSTFEIGKVAIGLRNVVFTGQNISSEYEQWQATTGQLTVTAPHADFELNDLRLSRYQTEFSTAFSSVAVSHLEGAGNMASVQRIASDKVRVVSGDQLAPEITSDRIQADSLVFSKPLNESKPALIAFKSFNVDGIRYANNKLALVRLSAHDLLANIHLDETGQLDSWVLPSTDDKVMVNMSNESSHTTLDSGSEPSSVQAFAFQFERIELLGENSIHLKDEGVTPTNERTFFIDQLYLTDLDSQQPDTPSPFSLEARSNEYATIDFEGAVTPLSQAMDMTITGEARMLSLPTLSSYVRESLGFEIKAGQLDVDVNAVVADGDIKGKMKLHMRGAEMSGADNHEADSVKGKTLIPVNVALGMLKDGDGNIKLTVPLSGDLQDPNFGFSGLMVLVTKKAVLMQTKSYLMNTFVPYASVVSVAISATKYALKLRFSPLVYAPAQTDVSDAEKEYLSQFVALLKDHKSEQVKLCAIAAPSDIGLVGEAGKAQLSDAQLTQLKAVALERVENFKRYVLLDPEISPSRLLLCAPEVDSDYSAQPKIKISI